MNAIHEESASSVERSTGNSLRILLVTSATHTANDKNFNHFQRVYFLSRSTDLTILARKGADFSPSATARTKIICANFSGKGGQILKSLEIMLFRRGEQWDVVLTEPSLLGICGFFGKLFKGTRWVVDVWDIPIRSTMARGYIAAVRLWFTRRLIGFLYRWAELFIVSIVPDFEFRTFRIPKEKMMLLENAIWPIDSNDAGHRSAQKTEAGFSIICMRSVHTADMGLDTLAEAFLILLGKIPGLSLTIVGRIPEHVRSQVAVIEENHAVRFLDFVEHGALTEMIRSASACVVPFKDVPDLAQTYPIKVIEYLALGKPVVASAIAGMSRMISDGVNGLLFQAGDPEDMAAKLLALYHDRDLRSRLTENARRLDRRFDCRVKNERIIEQLGRLVSKSSIVAAR